MIEEVPSTKLDLMMSSLGVPPDLSISVKYKLYPVAVKARLYILPLFGALSWKLVILHKNHSVVLWRRYPIVGFLDIYLVRIIPKTRF